MARTLTETEIKALSLAVSRLTKRDVFTLTSLGFLAMDDEDNIVRSAKGERALKRESKRIRAAAVREPVEVKVREMLADPEAHIQHRAVWVAVGRDEFERDEVLVAMRTMRDEGLLETVNTSGNNFQIFWKATPTLNG